METKISYRIKNFYCDQKFKKKLKFSKICYSNFPKISIEYNLKIFTIILNNLGQLLLLVKIKHKGLKISKKEDIEYNLLQRKNFNIILFLVFGKMLMI